MSSWPRCRCGRPPTSTSSSTDFAGDDRAIADYLTGEILAHQPPEVRRFLLRTSVLERLTAPLCDALTGDNDGQRMLDELERRGLFLSPLDNRRRWFRYHRLFRDVLRYTLVAEDRDLERVLLHRAANWHLAEGHLDDAIGYLIEARAWDQIIDLVLHHGRAMWERGDATVALRWLDAVPERSLSPAYCSPPRPGDVERHGRPDAHRRRDPRRARGEPHPDAG